jgi:antitoxin VapB
MRLNIDAQEAQNLAHELSKLTGESLTVAVTEAIRERLERLQNTEGRGLADRLLRIGKDCAAHLEEPLRSADHGTILYDDRGFPRPRQ